MYAAIPAELIQIAVQSVVYFVSIVGTVLWFMLFGRV